MNYDTIKKQLETTLQEPTHLLHTKQMELLRNHSLASYELQCLLFEKVLKEGVCHYYLNKLREG